MQKVFFPFRGKTLGDYNPQHPSQEVAKEAVRDYIENLDARRETGRGLALMGPNGVGKTLLASLVLAAAERAGYRIEAIESSSYVQLNQDYWQAGGLVRQGFDDYEPRLAKLRHHLGSISGTIRRSADWVLLDDIGREPTAESGWSAKQLFDVLRARHNRGLPFLVTSNLPLGDLGRVYTEGFTSLLAEATTLLVVIGDDYRTQIAMHREINQWTGDK